MNERFAMLMDRYLDREADAAEISELQTILRENAGARERFWERAEWHALYRQWGEQEWGHQAARAERSAAPKPVRPTPLKVLPRRKPKCFPVARWAVVGIAALAAVVLAYFAVLATSPVATLERVADARWKSGTMETGAKLKKGRFQLEKGAIVLSFKRGARAVIEGPADFEIRGDNEMNLTSGRVRARIPASAHGFRVETPQFTAVDLGTEFGCDAGLSGAGELHVFTGKVDMQTSGSTVVHLSETQAMRMEHGVPTPLGARPLSFLSEEDLTLRELREKGDFFGAWQIASRQFDANPATVLHLDFENTGAVVRNRALKAPPQSDATMLGCKSVEGRWPGKPALAFNSGGDRLKIALPGHFQSMTIVAWVRVESLLGGKNVLLSGRNRNDGEVSWYLYSDGSLGIGVLSPYGWHNFNSEPVFNRKAVGSWAFLATVLDGPSGTATHYFNGKPVGSKEGLVKNPLQLAAADIGNRINFEKFAGDIDELAVLSAPMSSEEIARLYQQGKPAP